MFTLLSSASRRCHRPHVLLMSHACGGLTPSFSECLLPNMAYVFSTVSRPPLWPPTWHLLEWCRRYKKQNCYLALFLPYLILFSFQFYFHTRNSKIEHNHSYMHTYHRFSIQMSSPKKITSAVKLSKLYDNHRKLIWSLQDTCKLGQTT